MTPAHIVKESRHNGLILTATADGRIKVIGEKERICQWLPLLKAHKDDLLTIISDPDFIECWEERAAIMEFSGKMSRQDAERAAYQDCKVIWLSERKKS